MSRAGKYAAWTTGGLLALYSSPFLVFMGWRWTEHWLDHRGRR